MSIRLPLGVRDFLPAETEHRRRVERLISDEFAGRGYRPIETPMVELAEVLDRGLSPSERAMVVRFVEPSSGEVVALRPDITPQVARLAGTLLGPDDLPTRWSYTGTVARMGNGARGQREILQSGVELLGVSGTEGDVEIISMAAAALAGSGAKDARIDLGHVAFVRLVLSEVDAQIRDELATALGRKDHASLQELAKAVPEPLREIVGIMGELYGPADSVMSRIKEMSLPPALESALAELDAILLGAQGKIPDEQYQRLSVDLGEVRGRGYYTGLRIAGYVDGAGQAVVRGGRYDELISRYGQDLAAVGMAVDIDMLAGALSLASVSPQS